MITQNRSTDRIRERAREALRLVYDKLAREQGKLLTAEEFYPVKLESLVSTMGWNCRRVPSLGWNKLGEKLWGGCIYSTKTIELATDGSRGPEQEAFTLAHEIGHALLHGGSQPCTIDPDTRTEVVVTKVSALRPEERLAEREANNFASELLMPEKAVRIQFRAIFGKDSLWSDSLIVRGIIRKKGRRADQIPKPDTVAPSLAVYKKTSEDGKQVRALTEFFGVSRTAMAIRLVELELVY